MTRNNCSEDNNSYYRLNNVTNNSNCNSNLVLINYYFSYVRIGLRLQINLKVDRACKPESGIIIWLRFRYVHVIDRCLDNIFNCTCVNLSMNCHDVRCFVSCFKVL